jgi:hypothetical protein
MPPITVGQSATVTDTTTLTAGIKRFLGRKSRNKPVHQTGATISSAMRTGLVE